MSIRIFFTNGNGAGPSVPYETENGTTAVGLFLSMFPTENARNFDITVNGAPVIAGYVLRDGDQVIIARRDAGRQVQAQAPAPTPVARDIRITFLNTLESGFAQERTVREGTTYEEFLRSKNIASRNSIVRIRGNRPGAPSVNPTAGYVLQDGDLLSVTPSNISGARR